ncbi:type IV secretion system ATPase VirD4 [Rhizobium sp. VS19-DR104.2]|uniref:type IV secretion system ATPase VirD4 n=1 Tax=unclassified Rhizobium TaxID=2613769 RepID=UPI001C5B0517|nr:MULTISPECIES: type IV secretion system ATPase VirD4 [unclassified Rhizobium]MBZ5763686.1 type IV secretion system ATPase VirD4 [Rhizobium sp. VS19-DR96]MBZ5769618.1 type IV secretion system ATPase VirD4 [Rhizobium sp. VS19-DR129.2]MBZ5777161.1 type IV secretion system ATPase VirD4 [Rhizobium sp. VS19-DRK62.2]MBZ5788300.1 type IV secretion system ATPase VirD4 [Rhizobium sp. VS19-DR121]MBZ5805761.1 type IV secretion system ATPase VirD4 [Rhizobium sp. VS19-DR181]
MNSGKYTPLRLTVSIVFSLAVGFCAASLYVTFRHGFTGEMMMTFSVFAFLHETPLYSGYASATFYRGLIIIVVTSMLVLVCQLFSSMREREHHGTARWAGSGEMRHARYLQRYRHITGPIFGKTCGPRWFGSYLSNGEQPHSLVVAPTRAGKGVGIVIPTLLTFKGSVIALDVKGELFELTSRARKSSGDAVFKFSPLDQERRTHCYNPVLDIAALPPERRFTETRRLAANLLTAKGKGAEGFIDGARDLFVAGILSCIERGTPTIGAVYDLFAQPGEKYKLFAQLAGETHNKEAQRIFDNMAGNDTKILTSYTSVLGDGGLNLWADPLIKAATSRSDFSVYDLRRKRTCIYLCVSPNDLEVIAPLMRLLFQQVVSILQRSLPHDDERHEVLFLLDEFKHLGKLEAVETAITTIAGYKGRFMFIIQSLSALTGTYDEAGKQNFLSNTGVQIFMATADDETPTYISKAIGDHTFQARSTSYTQARMFDHNIQISEQGAPLLRAEQVRLLDDDYEIVLIKGQPPLKLRKVRYYSDLILKRIFESQQGSLPEPEWLVLPEDVNVFDNNLDQSAADTPMRNPAQIEDSECVDVVAAQSKPVADPEQSVVMKTEVRPGSIGVDEGYNSVDTANSKEPSETAPALVAQHELLNQIISLQQRGGRG